MYTSGSSPSPHAAHIPALPTITVEYYGSPVTLKGIAQISTPDASSLLLQPYDKSSLKAIEKAIVSSSVGLTPNNDGETIRLSIPQLTSDRRKELTKLVAKLAEEGKGDICGGVKWRREEFDTVMRKEVGHLQKPTVKGNHMMKLLAPDIVLDHGGLYQSYMIVVSDKMLSEGFLDDLNLAYAGSEEGLASPTTYLVVVHDWLAIAYAGKHTRAVDCEWSKYFMLHGPQSLTAKLVFLNRSTYTLHTES
ncbi:hypothetical protein KSP40_PGU020054 [Platanthera guangdongensis]|uniref:Ribosome-recycling factor, chloroplastic n=1 Tax=Platanthera guangdongensis TaxID=2320717 RepID=A0ABR2LUP9_9ASPA